MFKQSGTAASTKVLRKTKTNESYKQPSTKSKVMLTDLCPEEKAKIGELVRTLELRKTQNTSLLDKITFMQAQESQYIKRLAELESSLQNHSSQEKELKEQLSLAKAKEEERERYISHLLAERQDIKKSPVCAQVEQFALTDPIITLEQGCQVVPKRKKQKSQQVQTETQKDAGVTRNRKGNSKSFERIMRKQYEGESPLKKSAIRISEDDEEEARQARYTGECLNEQEESEDFDELAKKWLELKERNMSKIKDSLKKSKSGRSVRVEPRDFSEEMREEGVSNEYENESFGPHLSKEKGRQFLNSHEAEFDEIELNRILKSKNFSASRLVHKSRIDSEESCRQRSMESKQRKQGNASLVNSRGRNLHLQSSNMSNSNNIDFYETDLLDIVNSIQP